jgi:hypothetical protein
MGWRLGVRLTIPLVRSLGGIKSWWYSLKRLSGIEKWRFLLAPEAMGGATALFSSPPEGGLRVVVGGSNREMCDGELDEVDDLVAVIA